MVFYYQISFYNAEKNEIIKLKTWEKHMRHVDDKV